MFNLSIDEQRFKAMNKRLIQTAKSQGFELKHQSGLQLLSQALLGKPYEEILATLLKDETVSAPKNNVTILRHGNESILTLNGDYIVSDAPGTDMEIPFKALRSQAESLARAHGTEIQFVELPTLIGSDPETHEILSVAWQMGYMKETPSILDLLAGKDDYLILVDGIVCGDYIDPKNYHQDIEAASDAGHLIFDEIIWSPELFDGEDKYEYYLTLGDLCRATTDDGGQTWIIPHEVDPERSKRVEFVPRPKPQGKICEATA